VHAESDDGIGSVHSVENQDRPPLPDDMQDPVDVIMHDDPRELNMDLLSRIQGLYRLLDLISEQGSGGAGVIIASGTAQGGTHYIFPPLQSG